MKQSCGRRAHLKLKIAVLERLGCQDRDVLVYTGANSGLENDSFLNIETAVHWREAQ